MSPHLSVFAIACVLLMALLSSPAACATKRVVISNGYARATIDGASITSLQVDPSGKGRFGVSFVKGLKPEFWESAPGTRVEADPTRAVVSGLVVWDHGTISSSETSDPARLEPGHTLGQTFTVPAGHHLTSISVKLPTWNTKTSGATLSLYSGDRLLARRQMKRVEDNSWQSIGTESPMGEGRYRVEISDPIGTIGWWSGKASSLPDGEALADGSPAPGDRAIQVNLRKNAGEGTLTFTLDGPRLTVDAEVRASADAGLHSLPWRWRTTWTRSGYDCTPKAGVLFSRFYTDTQRYVPIQQLKRRDTGGLSFDNCKWIEMDGTRDADLRLQGDRLHLHWEMLPKEMSLRLDSPITRDGDVWRSRWSLAIKPREDDVPPEFPRFACSDKAMEADLNTFLWERAFSYPSAASGSAEWYEWMALMRAWIGGQAREGELLPLESCPITDEGYVYTWGGTIGWPLVKDRDTRHFDTNARFVLACWRHYLWTGDVEWLRAQSERIHKAMRYQLEVLHGIDGLIVTPEVKTGRHKDLTDNYWDILPFGHLDAYANAVFYGSITAIEQIDSALGLKPLTDYAALRRKAHARYDEVFWDEAKGRYIGCVDIDGEKHDYGFTFVNLEALFYGLGDAAKAERIYHWMETEPTSTGKADTYTKWIFAPRATTIHNPMWKDSDPDKVVGGESVADRVVGGESVADLHSLSGSDTPPTPVGTSSDVVGGESVGDRVVGGESVADTHSLSGSDTPPTPVGTSSDVVGGESVADRVVGGESVGDRGERPGPWWTFWWHGTPFGDQCQDGGAILYTSFFDLMDRARYSGADNAWQRFREIIERYRMPDRLCGGAPLYRGEKPQQEDAGSVGVDMPFPESGLVPCYFLYGVIGAQATPDGLRITPNLPKSLDYAEVRNVDWHGMSLRVRVTSSSVEVEGARKDGTPFSLKRRIKPGGSVLVDEPKR